MNFFLAQIPAMLFGAAAGIDIGRRTYAAGGRNVVASAIVTGAVAFTGCYIIGALLTVLVIVAVTLPY